MFTVEYLQVKPKSDCIRNKHNDGCALMMIKDKLSYVVIWYWGRFVLPLTAFFILVHPVPAAGYEWKASDGLSGWHVENVSSVQSTGEGIRIYGQSNATDFLLLAPEGIIRDASYIKIRLRSMSIGSYVKCILMSRGKIMLSHTYELYSGRSWKEYVFDMRGANIREHPIDFLAFTFKHNENVEIKDVTVVGPSFSEISWIQGLQSRHVNLLYPFTVFGYSLNVVLLVTALALGLSIELYRRVKLKKSSLALMCATLLAFSIILDVREIYEERAIMKSAYDDYLDAPLLEKRYFWQENLVGFTDFIRENINSGSRIVHFFGDEDRYEYFRYLLYPIKVEQGKGSLADVNAVWESDNTRVVGNKIIRDGQAVADGGKGIAFSPKSFLYLKDTP